MSSFELFAKSKPVEPVEGIPNDSLFLPQHLKDVHAAAIAIVDSTGASQLSLLGLEEKKWLPRFKQVVLLSAAIHDLGKANDHFQGMLQPQALPHRRSYWQGLRHEWGTVLMTIPDMPHHGLKAPVYSCGNWLRKAVDHDEDYLAVLWAVSGHHPKFGRPSPPRTAREGGGAKMRLLMDHDQFRHILSWLKKEFSLEEPALIHERDLTVPLVGKDSVIDQILGFYVSSHRLWEQHRRERSEFYRFVAVVKNTLVAADVAGSAVPQQGQGKVCLTEWVSEAFRAIPTAEEMGQVIVDRLNEKRETPLTVGTLEQGLRDFQKSVGQSEATVTLVKAGCGSGKTLAAYEWARKQCPGKRLFFCYPTTGTATEGFRDYLLASPQGDNPQKGKSKANLFHSRQEIDFELLDIQEDYIEQDDGDQKLADAIDAALRIESLKIWSTPIASATCDVVLGLMQNNRRGLYGWPAFAQGVFIFDEIHAYDDRLFGALLRFLKDMPGAKVLLMTASLPQSREAAIKRVAKSLEMIEGPKDLEELPRYHRHKEEYSELDSQALRELIQAELEAEDTQDSRKVLWVCNTVDRAMEAYDAAISAGLPAILYHSRFRYGDRVERHKEVIQAFDDTKPVLAICTQVAEMSLDLSASLLITDKAPVPALIQRLGRLNRRASPGNHSGTKPFILINPTGADGSPFCWPYDPEEFRWTELWLKDLKHDNLSQKNLSDAWKNLPEHSQRRATIVPCAWLDGGPSTQVLELRDCSPGVTVLLKEDEEQIRAGEKLSKFTIPMPVPYGKLRQLLLNSSDRKRQGCFVVSNDMIQYDKMRGAQWRKNAQ